MCDQANSFNKKVQKFNRPDKCSFQQENTKKILTNV